MHCPDQYQILYLPINDLIVHEKLTEIYGEYEYRPSLETSIRERGILTPLWVSTRGGVNTVLSGKCRLQIAKELGFSTVPVRTENYSSADEELDILFALNLRREEKTHYQKFAEAPYFESALRPKAKARQQQGASYARQALLESNLTEAENENDSQDLSTIDVRAVVAKNLLISTGSYSKGKRVFKFISQLIENNKLRSASALQQELNRSIDAAYKFIGDSRQDRVIDAIESGEINTIREGLGLIGTGHRNAFRKFEVGQVYQFQKEVRPNLSRLGRVTKITNEFIAFAFRDFNTDGLETINLRPSNINATLQSDPSVEERARVFRLLEKFGSIYPLQVALTQMLDITNFTMKEERFLAYFETGKYEEMVKEREIEFLVRATKDTDVEKPISRV